MTRSLKFQMLQAGRTLAMVGLILLIFIPYSILIGSGDADRFSYYLGMCFGVAGIMSFVYPLSTMATQGRMALASGATRRGWFCAYVVTKLVMQVVLVAMVLFLAGPLGSLVFRGGVTYGVGLEAILPFTPLILCATLLLAAVGEALGYVMARFSGKVMFMVLLVGAVLCSITAGFIVSLIGFEFLLDFVSMPALCLACLALCVPVQFASWRMLRRMAV